MTCRVDVLWMDASPGQRLAVSGASAALGSWDPSRAVQLAASPTSQGLWSGTVPRQDANAKFKLLVLDANGTLAAWEPLKHNRKWPGEAVKTGCRVRMKFGKKRMKVEQAPAINNWLNGLSALLGCCLAPEQDSKSEMDMGPPHPKPVAPAPQDPEAAAAAHEGLGGPQVKKAIGTTKLEQSQAPATTPPSSVAPGSAAGIGIALPTASSQAASARRPPSPSEATAAAPAPQVVAPKAGPAPPSPTLPVPSEGVGGNVLGAGAIAEAVPMVPPKSPAAPQVGASAVLPGQVAEPLAPASQRLVPAPMPAPKEAAAPPAVSLKAKDEAEAPSLAPVQVKEEAPPAAAVKSAGGPVELDAEAGVAARSAAAPLPAEVKQPWFLKPSVGTWLQPAPKFPPALVKAIEEPRTGTTALADELEVLNPKVGKTALLLEEMARQAPPPTLLGPRRSLGKWARMPSVATWAQALPSALQFEEDCGKLAAKGALLGLTAAGGPAIGADALDSLVGTLKPCKVE
mmetsp:Transcript_88886/g.246929  ORF Transcript_88886/g.246929 Transcript_88886/m.246929 type:complete len:514 (-) Transcript_88886:235-1776(-)